MADIDEPQLPIRVELPPVRVIGWDRIWATLEEAFADEPEKHAELEG